MDLIIEVGVGVGCGEQYTLKGLFFFECVYDPLAAESLSMLFEIIGRLFSFK